MTFIYNGSGWQWEYDMPQIIRRDLKMAYNLKQILQKERPS